MRKVPTKSINNMVSVCDYEKLFELQSKQLETKVFDQNVKIQNPKVKKMGGIRHDRSK